MAPSPTRPDDADLIACLLAGDGETVERVRVWIRGAFKPYRGRLAPEFEDLEQDILLDLTRALREGRYRGTSRLRTYVRAYTHHKCIDRLRALDRRQWIDISDLDLPSRSPSALEELSRSETVELALRVFAEMSESCRELWRMLQQGLPYREMSRRLGVAAGTLRARVLRCRRRALEMREKILADVSGAARSRISPD